MSRTPHSTADAATQITLDALVANVGQELARLATLSGQMQTALSLCHFTEHTEGSAIRGLQGIDRITQTLEDLGRLMLTLAEAVSPRQRLDPELLLAQVHLHDLRIRLGAPKADETCLSADFSGDVVWL